jgi:hypothetical protein
VLTDATLAYDDLALDLLVYPDGRQLVLDEDEFQGITISTEERRCALKALRELRRLFKEHHKLDVRKLI